MDIAFLTIAELNRAYATKELSPVEVTRALLDRIAKHDRKLDSFIRVTEDVALAEAKAAEAELMAGKRRGPMHGVPYGLKDIVETAGIPTTGHSKLRQHHMPTADAEVTRRLKQGGGILIGKLATWEFANGGPSFDLPWPPARNPWDRERFPGGSSSGPGAAVAAGFVTAAIGTDTGGSIRGPAAFCGIAGLKPTYGRVSRRGVFPNTFTMDHAGPMTRSAEDIALMLQVIAGYDPADPGSEDCPVPDFAAALGQGIKGLRLGLVEGWHDAPGAHPDLGSTIAEAVAVLRTPRRHRRAGETVELTRLYRFQNNDFDRRTLHNTRTGHAHPAAGFRSHPAQPHPPRCADPGRGTRLPYAGAPPSPASSMRRLDSSTRSSPPARAASPTRRGPTTPTVW